MFYSVRRLNEKVKIASGKVAVFQGGPGDPKKRALYEVIVQMVLTFAIGGVAIFVLTNNYSDATQKLAAGWLGTVLGYWFR